MYMTICMIRPNKTRLHAWPKKMLREEHMSFPSSPPPFGPLLLADLSVWSAGHWGCSGPTPPGPSARWACRGSPTQARSAPAGPSAFQSDYGCPSISMEEPKKRETLSWNSVRKCYDIVHYLFRWGWGYHLWLNLALGRVMKFKQPANTLETSPYWVHVQRGGLRWHRGVRHGDKTPSSPSSLFARSRALQTHTSAQNI